MRASSRACRKKYPGRFCACFGFVPELSRKIYAGADMFLMPSKSEPCGLSQMIALRYGTVPIVRETGGLKDSISDSGDGKGNGFTFQTYDSQDMLGAVRRAIAGYWNEEGGWKVLMKRAMECDNSWGKSANEYIRLYRAMLERVRTKNMSKGFARRAKPFSFESFQWGGSPLY